MRGRRMFLTAVFALSLLWVLLSALPGGRAASVAAAALGEVGYTEGEGEFTKYGAAYGLSNAYWCDTFVSWCAQRAGVSGGVFPRSESCTAHIRRFQAMDRYEPSAARGGGYTPRQGDLIFFYNPVLYPDGRLSGHVGLVLYTEGNYVFTIEGNALANRLDMDYETFAGLRDSGREPPNYVSVNYYPLSDAHIHGYGVPDYGDRTPLKLDGFVDLAGDGELAEAAERLCGTGILAPTSAHTFSPNHGMTRGEFADAVEALLQISGFPVEEVFVEAPGAYISPDDAREVLREVQVYAGVEAAEFAFSPGDYSYMEESPYAVRGDIARALFSLLKQISTNEE